MTIETYYKAATLERRIGRLNFILKEGFESDIDLIALVMQDEKGITNEIIKPCAELLRVKIAELKEQTEKELSEL